MNAMTDLAKFKYPTIDSAAIRAELSQALNQVQLRAAFVGEGDLIAQVFIYSGGVSDVLLENVPTIYLDPMAAIADWRDRTCAWLEAERAAKIRFLEVPKCERFVMTEQGEEGGHRLVATRYGARAKIAIVERKPERLRRKNVARRKN